MTKTVGSRILMIQPIAWKLSWKFLCRHRIRRNLRFAFYRVAAGPGKPGSQGKVREFYQSGKVRENDEKIRKVREKQTKN